MALFDTIRAGASGAADSAYEIDRSLRFHRSDDAKLTRSVSSAGNRQTWTWSGWIKTTTNTGENFLFAVVNSGYSGNSEYTTINLYANKLRLSQATNHIRAANNIFRDPSAWYHIVVKYDSTDSTADDRAILYVNGERLTDLSNNISISENYETAINNNLTHTIGGSGFADQEFDGYMAEVNFLDGYAYDPSYFGKTNATTGQWIPKEYTGSYGTNGFYLNFSDNSGTSATTLGKDSSGNGNNWTPNNFSVSAGSGNDSLEDTPTNNFCTLNQVFRFNGRTAPNFSNGGLEVNNTGGGDMNAHGTFAVKSGKYYFEGVSGNADGVYGTHFIGVQEASPGHVNQGNYRSDGRVYDQSASPTQSGTTYDGTQTIGVAFDADTGKVWFAKNNTWISSGDPANGNNPAFTYSTTEYLQPFVAFDNTSDGKTWVLNFGQRAFTYTPPTGFVALNSTNLPDPTILLPNKHFDNLLYSGNGGTQTLTGLNFQPDWIWIKQRSSTRQAQINDSVRGAGKVLVPSEVDSVQTFSNSVTAFNSDGFSIGDHNGVNENSNTFVAWNWNAGNTDGKTYTVTVVDDSGNKYRFDGFGTSAVTLDLAEGGTYIFNYPSAHPLKFSTTSDGTHGGGSEYTTGVTHNSSTQVTIVVAASAPTLYYYCSSHSGMGGQVNTNSTLGSSNFDGTKQAVVKVNATAGFSIVSYTGTGSSITVGHGLGVAPEVMIFKNRGENSNWGVYHSGLDFPTKDLIYLDLNEAANNHDPTFDNTAPTSSVFTVGDYGIVNKNGFNHIAYCFSSVAGYSKFGSYIGNGSTDGTFVFTGFKPAFILWKPSTQAATDWVILDNKRDTFNVADAYLLANTSAAEGDLDLMDILSNGFKLRQVSGNNESGQTIIYLAFAESPFKNARAR